MQEQPRYVLFLLEYQASKALRPGRAYKRQHALEPEYRNNDLPFPDPLEQVHQDSVRPQNTRSFLLYIKILVHQEIFLLRSYCGR